MPLREDFENSPRDFLRNHAVMVNGVMTSYCRSGGIQLGAALSGRAPNLGDPSLGPFDFSGGGRVHAKILAPKIYAYFAETVAAERPDIVPWSVPQVTISFDNAANVAGTAGMECFLIPYEGSRTLGVRLPEGAGPAYAFTATQNGCTVEVSGSEQAPFASHSNVINAAVPNRQAEIINRAAALQLAYLGALPAGADMADERNDPTANRSMFGHYTAVPGFNNRTVNYTDKMRQMGLTFASTDGHFTPVDIKGARRDRGFRGHSRYHLRIRPMSVDTIRNAASQALVIGVRRNGRWRFYHQSWMPVSFDVSEHKKFGPKITTETVDVGQVHTAIVLNHGTLWPHRSETLINFT